MKCNIRHWLMCVVILVGIWLVYSPRVWASAVATGTGKITNIQYHLVNPSDGSLNWYYDNGSGGPAWRGEARVEVSDSQGGKNADFSTTPDGLGVINASASTSLANGLVNVDLTLEELYGEGSVTNPVDGWALAAPYGMMFDYFSIAPVVPGSTDPVEMYFSFDYEIHLTGQAELGAPYYSDCSVSMLLEYEDSFGNWQLVPDGQLFFSKVITGFGTDSEDVTFSGLLGTTVALDPYVDHVIQFTVYPNQDTPEPATLLLLSLGGLMLRKRRV